MSWSWGFSRDWCVLQESGVLWTGFRSGYETEMNKCEMNTCWIRHAFKMSSKGVWKALWICVTSWFYIDVNLALNELCLWNVLLWESLMWKSLFNSCHPDPGACGVKVWAAPSDTILQRSTGSTSSASNQKVILAAIYNTWKPGSF